MAFRLCRLYSIHSLKASEYLKDMVHRYIEGEMTIDEVREQIKSYCQSKTNRESDDEGKQEVDKVSDNITKVLSTRTLDCSTNGYISLCRRIFEEGEKFANKYENMTS